MQRCALCGRKISDDDFNFGLSCLKRLCTQMQITDVTSVNDEKVLNKKIMHLCNKKGLTNIQKNMLTNRYLTLQMLNKLPLEQYSEERKSIQYDIDIINRNTTIDDLKSFESMTLKNSAEIVRLYNKHQNTLYKLMNGEYDEDLTKYFTLIRFAFSAYYAKKPYLSDLHQVFQHNVLKNAAFVLRMMNCKFAADCLEHSLQEDPEDIEITNGYVVEEIKEHYHFKETLDKILTDNKTKSSFSFQDIISFEHSDLFLALHDATLKVSGKKKNSNLWDLKIEIFDLYDFTKLQTVKDYLKGNNFIEQFAAATGNNLAMLATSCKVLYNYNINIKFSIENWEVK